MIKIKSHQNFENVFWVNGKLCTKNLVPGEQVYDERLIKTGQGEFREWFGEKGGTFQYRLPPLVPDYVWNNQSGAFNLLRSIKAALDPNNILSPGTFELGGV